MIGRDDHREQPRGFAQLAQARRIADDAGRNPRRGEPASLGLDALDFQPRLQLRGIRIAGRAIAIDGALVCFIGIAAVRKLHPAEGYQAPEEGLAGILAPQRPVGVEKRQRSGKLAPGGAHAFRKRVRNHSPHRFMARVNAARCSDLSRAT